MWSSVPGVPEQSSPAFVWQTCAAPFSSTCRNPALAKMSIPASIGKSAENSDGLPDVRSSTRSAPVGVAETSVVLPSGLCCSIGGLCTVGFCRSRTSVIAAS